MTRLRRRCALGLTVATAVAAASAAGHPSPGQPYERVTIAQRLTGNLRTSVRARWAPGVPVPDPTVAGVRVRLVVEAGGEATRVIELPPAGWTEGRAFRFRADDCNGRTVSARLRTGRGGGRFSLDLPGCTAPLVAPEATRVALQVTSGDVRWCGDVVELRARPRRVTGKSHAPLVTCSCEPLPAGTFEAIERRVFARHGCGVLGCHGGVPGQGDLSLAPGLAYAGLVAVPSSLDPARLRVAPGDPGHSFLWEKLAVRTLGLAGVPGLGMPMGNEPVDADELEAVRLWIAAGAPATGIVADAQVLLDCRP